MRAKHAFVIDYPQQFEKEHRHGSLVILNDVNFNPDWKKILYGTVESNPDSDKHKKLQFGDRIYFHYLISEEEYMFEGKLTVPCENVFCYVRDGKITPYGDFILSEPYYPDGTDIIDVMGKKIATVIGKSGLVEKTDIKHSKRLSRVIHSNPDFDDIQDNDIVIMKNHCDQSYEIEGNTLFPIEYRNILGIYEVS